MTYARDADELANKTRDCGCERTGCPHEMVTLMRAGVFAMLAIGDQMSETHSYLDTIADHLDTIAIRLDELSGQLETIADNIGPSPGPHRPRHHS